ncbi:hypothetical protein NPIL_680361 [Nephila pilipes]|uniref:Uncharacterized protein n=1 Tax=Nephila pilipes TaxID=299642 RepID=A0A8X6NKX1_NEPPI|nr:hypothetical protein NPIL_680361 [Nephila pilipes]
MNIQDEENNANNNNDFPSTNYLQKEIIPESEEISLVTEKLSRRALKLLTGVRANLATRQDLGQSFLKALSAANLC